MASLINHNLCIDDASKEKRESTILATGATVKNDEQSKRSRKLTTITKAKEVPSPKRNRLEAKEEISAKEFAWMHPFQPPLNLKVTILNGIRYLQPYWGIFSTHAKGRWVNKTINDMIKEFTIFHALYGIAAVRTGRIFINGQQMTDPDYRFRNNDHILHLNHRHETEIPALPIQIIDETDDYLVINKPPGLPVHPCGRYNVHSVMSLLTREYGRVDSDKLRPVFRLDRNTTGVLMFAKNYNADIKFKNAITKRQLKKEYIAKVEGIFPDEGEIVCRQPIGLLSRVTGIRCIRSDGQDALSRFRLIHTDVKENTSIIHCKIETGRTHQIRIHLQYLGYPIVNDNLYNDLSWGPFKGRGCDYGGKSMEELQNDVAQRHDKQEWLIASDQSYDVRLREIADSTTYRHEEHELRTLKLEELPDYDPICWDCAILEKKRMIEKDWQMPLHCLRYTGDDWSFEAPLPEWAKKAIKLEGIMSASNEGKPQTSCAIFNSAPNVDNEEVNEKSEKEMVMAQV